MICIVHTIVGRLGNCHDAFLYEYFVRHDNARDAAPIPAYVRNLGNPAALPVDKICTSHHPPSEQQMSPTSLSQSNRGGIPHSRAVRTIMTTDFHLTHLMHPWSPPRVRPPSPQPWGRPLPSPTPALTGPSCRQRTSRPRPWRPPPGRCASRGRPSAPAAG